VTSAPTELLIAREDTTARLAAAIRTDVQLCPLDCLFNGRDNRGRGNRQTSRMTRDAALRAAKNAGASPQALLL
jgi:hypothetical protein